MKVLVTGSRRWRADSSIWKSRIYAVLDAIHTETPISLIITGAEPLGADRCAGDWALRNGIPLAEYPSEWKAYGMAAGPKRNQWMLEFSNPDLVVAFPTEGGRGTQDTMRRAEAAGIPMKVVRFDQD